MKEIITELLITLFYYIIAYFLLEYALNKFPSNGGPSEAVFLLLGFVILSVVIVIYSLVKFTKGDMSKMVSIIIHLIAMPLLLKLLMQKVNVDEIFKKPIITIVVMGFFIALILEQANHLNN